MSTKETYSREGVICPYCKHLHKEDLPYTDGEIDTYTCEKCGKEFEVDIACVWRWIGRVIK